MQLPYLSFVFPEINGAVQAVQWLNTNAVEILHSTVLQFHSNCELPGTNIFQ